MQIRYFSLRRNWDELGLPSSGVHPRHSVSFSLSLTVISLKLICRKVVDRMHISLQETGLMMWKPFVKILDGCVVPVDRESSERVN